MVNVNLWSLVIGSVRFVVQSLRHTGNVLGFVPVSVGKKTRRNVTGGNMLHIVQLGMPLTKNAYPLGVKNAIGLTQRKPDRICANITSALMKLLLGQNTWNISTSNVTQVSAKNFLMSMVMCVKGAGRSTIRIISLLITSLEIRMIMLSRNCFVGLAT